MSRRAWAPLLTGLILVVTGTLSSAAGPALAAEASTAPTTSARATLSNAQFANRLLKLTNSRRKAVGCRALKANAALNKAARIHSRRMANAGQLSHQLAREPGLAKRITKAGYKRWTAAAENISWGAATPWRVYKLWLNSTSHRRNMLRCAYRDAGLGVIVRNGSTWVTLDLGRRR